MKPEHLSLLIIVVAAFIYIGLERLYPYERAQRMFRRGFWTDFIMYSIVQSYLLGLVISALIRWIDGTTGLSRLELVSSWPLWTQCAFFFVVHDFYIYWFHRLQHANAYLWRTHEAHHSVRDVDWVAGSRSHPVEILINQTIEFAPIVLLGAAPEVALFKATIDAVWGMWIHSNIGVRSGRLQYVINGPEMHRWHHAEELAAPGKNFSTKIAIWDWLFGTAYLPGDQKPRRYGLGSDAFPEEREGAVPGLSMVETWARQTLSLFRRFPRPQTSERAALGVSEHTDG